MQKMPPHYGGEFRSSLERRKVLLDLISQNVITEMTYRELWWNRRESNPREIHAKDP